MSQDKFYFSGFRYPHYTQVPDELFDVLLPHLREAELKALLYIIRRTFGFKKASDAISFNQFLHGITTKDGRVLDQGCGLRDRTSLSKALQSLEEKGIILSEKRTNEEKGVHETTVYNLRFSEEGVVGETYYRSMNPLPRVVGEPDQQETEQQTDKQQTDNVVVDKLIEAQIDEKKAHDLARKFSRECIEEKIAFLDWKLELQESSRKRRGRPISDPTGWLVRAIEKDFQPPEAFYEYRKYAEGEMQGAEVEEEQQALEFDWSEQDESLAQLVEEYGTSQSETDLWKQVLGELKLQLPKSTFETWLSPTHLLVLDKDGKAVISVSNGMARDWLEHRLADKVKRTLAGFSEHEDLELEFVVLRGDHQTEPGEEA